jgi:hypothetical protein
MLGVRERHIFSAALVLAGDNAPANAISSCHEKASTS